jgi:diguanylate cyclase (GGDEF)-like protein
MRLSIVAERDFVAKVKGRAFYALIASAALAVALPVSGMEPRNLRFRHITPEDGLSQSTVHAIVQDREGLMWFGTQEGINRYDGYELKTFGPDSGDNGSKSFPIVRALHEDREGVLWVGTDGGLHRFDRATSRFLKYENDPTNPSSLSNNRIRVIFEDRDGAVWVGTEGGGLNRFDSGTRTFTRFNHNPSNPTSLKSDYIRSIAQDRDGSLWVGTEGGGLNRMDIVTGRFRHFVHDSENEGSLASDLVRVVYIDQEGTLWVGTGDAGLDRFDAATETFRHFRHDPRDPQSLAHDWVRAIRQDSRGTLWIGTDAGLCEYRAETANFNRYVHDATDPVSLVENRVTTIYEDRGAVLWVGTYSGVNSWNIGTGFFKHHKNDGTDANQVSGNLIQSFAESPDDRALWIAAYGNGLNRLDRKTGRFTHYRSQPNDPNSLADDRVMSLAVDREGSVWVGTIDSGLDRLDPRTGIFTHFKHDPANPSSLSRNAVTRIVEDRQGVLWVGTYKGGLNRMERRTGEFIRYQHDSSNPTSLSNDRVVSITEGEDGVLWIGTDGGGLNRFDPEKGTFSHYRHDPSDSESLSSDNVWVVHRDRLSRLWIGTQGAGLNRWEPSDRQAHVGRFKRYDKDDGLLSAVINGILEDESGNLWISTNGGISRFSPDTETFKNYDATDGLQSPEFNHGAFFKASDGEMFFGGSNGYNSFYPQLVRQNPHPPEVVLTAFLKFNQPVDLGAPADVREISLGHKDSVVAFEFAGLDYTAPEKNRYRYKLEGFDEDWIDAGRLRRATYTNLSPRSYTFRVKAANNDGVWNEEGLAVRVRMIPPPWRTWWAYGLYGLMVMGLLYAYAHRQAQKLEREAQYARNLQIEVEVRTQQLAQRNRELEAFNLKLEEASLTDSLTGFWNRRFLLQQIPKEIALVDRSYEPTDPHGKEARPSLLFLMFDLDGFKGLNDTYGHAAGDRVLIQVRQMLLEACRQSDTIIRWGGDEFLLVGRNADPQTAENLAERIRSVMEEKKFDVGLEQTVHLSCSIGFAFYPFDSARPSFLSWEQVIGVADRALYVAKESGRNTWTGILSTSRGNRPADLFKRLNEDLETLVNEGIVELRDSGHRRPRLVREPRTGASR